MRTLFFLAENKHLEKNVTKANIRALAILTEEKQEHKKKNHILHKEGFHFKRKKEHEREKIAVSESSREEI